MKIKSIILALLLGGPTYASDFSDSETSYSGATQEILHYGGGQRATERILEFGPG